jgi:hypothetical protein
LWDLGGWLVGEQQLRLVNERHGYEDAERWLLQLLTPQ